LIFYLLAAAQGAPAVGAVAEALVAQVVAMAAAGAEAAVLDYMAVLEIFHFYKMLE
jgi:hypothetical protein